jgi:hypothetical protein
LGVHEDARLVEAAARVAVVLLGARRADLRGEVAVGEAHALAPRQGTGDGAGDETDAAAEESGGDCKKSGSVIGVQCHPELEAEVASTFRRVFQAFVERAELAQERLKAAGLP